MESTARYGFLKEGSRIRISRIGLPEIFRCKYRLSISDCTCCNEAIASGAVTVKY